MRGSRQRFFFGLPPLGGDHQFQIASLDFISWPLDGSLTKGNMIIYGCEIPTYLPKLVTFQHHSHTYFP